MPTVVFEDFAGGPRVLELEYADLDPDDVAALAEAGDPDALAWLDAQPRTASVIVISGARVAVTRRAYSPDQQRDSSGRFGQGGGDPVEPADREGAVLPYGDVGGQTMIDSSGNPASVSTHSDVENTIGDWHAAQAGAEWRRDTVGGREYGRGSTTDADDYKMCVAHDLAGRMAEKGVTTDDLERFAADRGLVPYISNDGRVGLVPPFDATATERTAIEKDDPAYERLLAEGVASELVSTWAGTSNDQNPVACAIQAVAETTFGMLENTMDWNNPTETSAVISDHGGLIRSFLESQYDATQEMFAADGIQAIELSRGVDLADQYDADLGSMIQNQNEHDGRFTDEPVEMRPLNAFSSDPGTVENFTGNDYGATLTANVPVERILSTPATGNGCLQESEFVVLGGGDTRFDIDWVSNDTGRQMEEQFQSVKDAVEALPNGAAILENYSLDYEPDYEGDTTYADVFFTNPVTGEQIPTEGDATDVAAQVADWDPDPVTTATAGADDVNDYLPAGWAAELTGVGMFSGSVVQLTTDEMGLTRDLSPSKVLSDDFATADHQGVALAVAAEESSIVAMALAPALGGTQPADLAYGVRISDPVSVAGAGMGVTMLSDHVAVAVMAVVPLGLTADQPGLPGVDSGYLNVYLATSPGGDAGGTGSRELIASIPQNEVFAGGTDTLTEFAATAATAIKERLA